LLRGWDRLPPPLHDRHGLLSAVRVVGAAFLFGFAILAARRALHPVKVRDDSDAPSSSYMAVVVACLAFTWLNPAVYLDTVVLLGSVANTRSGHQWWFAAGAALGSILWFAGLGYGARLLAPLFRRPRGWRVLDAFVAIVMIGTGLRVLLGA
jgi:L-lysine exporter family protein LysE/ArgO